MIGLWKVSLITKQNDKGVMSENAEGYPYWSKKGRHIEMVIALQAPDQLHLISLYHDFFLHWTSFFFSHGIYLLLIGIKNPTFP